MSQFTTNKKIFSDKNKIQVALSCVILLFLWQIIAIKINNEIYDSMSFLEEYKLYREALNRFTTIFSIEIFKYNKLYKLNIFLTVNNLKVVLEKQILNDKTIFYR